jgi:Flp pilus assembly protein TadB
VAEEVPPAGARPATARRRNRDSARLVAASALIAAWLLLLLFGHPLGAAVHVALVAGLAILPWRLVRP